MGTREKGEGGERGGIKNVLTALAIPILLTCDRTSLKCFPPQTHFTDEIGKKQKRPSHPGRSCDVKLQQLSEKSSPAALFADVSRAASQNLIFQRVEFLSQFLPTRRLE